MLAWVGTGCFPHILPNLTCTAATGASLEGGDGAAISIF